MRRSRLVPIAVVALLSTGALTGCTSSGSAAGGSGSAGSAAAPAARSASGSSSALKAAAVDRSVVTTGSLRLVAAHPIRVADRVVDLVEAAGGQVALNRQDPSGRPSADLTLRIPAEGFPATLDDIERQGDVRDVSIRSTDVTARVTDTATRVANLRTSIARLQQLLARADSSSALVEIEGALTERQGSLEQLLAEQRTLADQVDLATLTVAVVPPAAASASGPVDFLAGLATGTRGLVAALGALAVGLGLALPWLVLLAALAAAALGVRRLVRRTRASSA